MRLVKVYNNHGVAYINPEYVEYVGPLDDDESAKIVLRDGQWVNVRENMETVAKKLMGEEN